MPEVQLQGSQSDGTHCLALSIFPVADVTSWFTACFLPLGSLRQTKQIDPSIIR